MPHQCTECGKTFDDGSTEMLSGCPECGGNKFQYLPEASDGEAESPPSSAEPPEPPEPPVEGSVARTVGNAATAVRDFVGSNSPPSGQPADGKAGHTTDDGSAASVEATDASVETSAGGVEASAENSAQASARSEVVSREELPPAPETATTTTARNASVESPPGVDSSHDSEDETDSESEADRPGLDQLREELNDQFESIKVIEPGQYELNLMELYDREEYIIALQEDGKYTIQVPEHWED